MRDTIIAHFFAQAARRGDELALRELVAGGAHADVRMTWREWLDAARAFAASLVDAGVQPGARVAILAGNTMVWPVAELGTLLAGAVGVGIYPTSSAPQLRAILADSAAEVLVVDGPTHIGTAAQAGPFPATLRVVVMRGPRNSGPSVAALDLRVERWERWMAHGRSLLEVAWPMKKELDARAARLSPDDDAAFIYTSGSTGEPKGARLSHRYILASVTSVRDTLGFVPSDSSLSFLPFAHAAERLFGLHTRILVGMSAGLVADHARLWDAARDFEPTVFGGVPRFFEKLHEALVAAEALNGASWTRALDVGRRRSLLRRTGAGVPDTLEREWRDAVAPIAEWLRGWVGGRLRIATSGGAALPVSVAETLDAAGITVLGAYGLTEHLCVAFNRPGSYAFDTVGEPMPGTELRISGDGEVQIRRGALTFSGYHGMPEATAEMFTDDGAWLRTGDLGRIDTRGHLHIVGRIKELIALSGGKKVAPIAIETQLVQDPLIANVVCFGEGRKFLSALVCLRPAAVAQWAREHGIVAGIDELVKHPAVLARVQAVVDRVNGTVSAPERIRRFALVGRELSLEAGELTATMKVRRAVVAERFRDEFEALYQ